MFETKIKNNEVYLEGIPSSKWTPKEWEKWKQNTYELLEQCNRIGQKLAIVARTRFNYKL